MIRSLGWGSLEEVLGAAEHRGVQGCVGARPGPISSELRRQVDDRDASLTSCCHESSCVGLEPHLVCGGRERREGGKVSHDAPLELHGDDGRRNRRIDAPSVEITPEEINQVYGHLSRPTAGSR